MADQEPQQDTTSQDAEPLPERIRVHALAKLLGVTSKRILAKLTEMGAEARSAQSNVDRAVAESVRDAFGPREINVTEPSADEQPGTTTPSGAADPVSAVPVVAAREPGPVFSAPDPVIAGSGAVNEPIAHQPSVQLFTHSEREVPHAVAPAVFEAPASVQAPLFLPPDAAAAEQLRKRRRAERDTRRPEPPVEPVEDEVVDSTEDEPESVDQQGDSDADGQPRRRRRGRRGRGRGRGEQHADSGEDGEDDASDTETAESEDRGADQQGVDKQSADKQSDTADKAAADNSDDEDEDDASEGSTRRRRRRRRRKVAGESGENETTADDDPPNTVVHEREPRNKSRGRGTVDEVQGITGSTRLEAKRQRRRDGREAGRRRPPILTESEFLARREAVDRVMVVREKSFPDHPTATQVAVLEDNVLVEHFVTSTGQASMVGNVYLGKVQNVLPSMEAAFVDIGRGRNGVLYAGEVNWEAAGLGGKERKIEQALKPGDQVLVQVSKDPVGHKGARLTTQISLAGRFLVYVPGGTSTGISRKLPDTERKRLKEILRDIVPNDAGVIIRTASEGVSETELARDVERLQATWRTIEKSVEGKDSGAPKTLYEEPDLLVKVIRDLFNEDFSKLVIEGDRAWSTVEKYIGTVAPEMLARVSRHENNGVDVFETYRIDEQLAKALDRKVWLPSGGTLVIDRTEAMTVVDVNTGKFTGSGGSNLEETVTRNNLEAAEEIVRQMRLRDIGGMIVVDFIDMVLESNRDLVLRRLTEALGRDRTRHQVSEVTSLGLVQMTRKKLGTGLVEAFSTTCEHCHGRGILVHNYPVEPSSGEDGAGRGRDSGSRRRRGREKGAASTAPAAANGTPVAEVAEEDIAVKRAHPVALAMAAHQSDDTDVVEVDEIEDVAAEVAADEVAEAPAPTRRTRSRRAARGAGRRGARAEELAAAEAKADEVAPDVSSADSVADEAESADTSSSDGAATADVPDTESADTSVSAAQAEPEDASSPDDTVADDTESDESESDESGWSERIPVTADRVELAPAAKVTPEPSPAAADSDDTTADRSASNGVAEPRTSGRRRRVARSAAAPAADSSGAVFVLPTGDQAPAAPVDYTAVAPVELPQRRPRRRAVGRPAGPPVDQES